VAPLTTGLQLLESAVRYALAGARQAVPRRLQCPTPCAGWDLTTLVRHVSDSASVLHEAITAGSASLSSAPGDDRPEPDPVGCLRRHATGLLAACAVGAAARPEDRVIVIGDRELTASMAAAAGAIEITVHGWDISVACGSGLPVPPGLAAVLDPIAPLLITPAIRPGLFADPVPVPRSACPGDQLVAFLGRHPRQLAVPRTG
jgi:uncharacterized protein (TIGR03086 family)